MIRGGIAKCRLYRREAFKMQGFLYETGNEP
jgi:hypothetical protein